VTDPALDNPVRISAQEFLSIGAGVWVWCTIGITFKRNGWHCDDRTFDKPLFPDRHISIGFNQAELAFSALT
jgi:hypothetical protein